MIARIMIFLKTTLWTMRLQELTKVKAFFIRSLRVLILAIKRFMKNDDPRSATVLTYYSMLNVVPLIAVAFAIAKGFGLDKIVENRIIQIAEEMEWQSSVTNQILTFANSLLGRAKGGIIAGVGVVLLLWTVISILGKIEDSFNTIWDVKKSRTLIRKFSDYITIIVLCPILFVMSSSATVVVAGEVNVIVNMFPLLEAISALISFCLSLLPYVFFWVILIVLYLVMPNTKVPLKSAIIGGIVAGTICQVVQWAYLKFQIGVASYSAIYGSFAALPLFLGWLQITWMAVLFGLEIGYASRHSETYGFIPEYEQIEGASKKFLLLRVFHLLVKNFSKGEKPLGSEQIAKRLEMPALLVSSLLNSLISAGLVSEVLFEDHSEVAFQPARTIEDITIQSTLDMYEQKGDEKFSGLQTGDAQKLTEHLNAISEAAEKSPGNVRLKDIN
jgi:membrane protein